MAVVLPHPQKHIHIAENIDSFPVNGGDFISRLQGLLQGTPLGEVRNDRCNKRLRAHVEAEDDDNPRQEIHQRARGENQQLSPEALVLQRRGIIRGLVLPLHGAKTAEWQTAQRVKRLALLLFEDGRTHAEGKFIHPHAAGLGSQKMSQFVDKYQHTKYQSANKYIYKCRHSLSVPTPPASVIYRAASRPIRSASSISPRLG